MRTIGNLILLLFLVLFGSGFLVAYSIELTQELKKTKDELARLQAEMQTLEGQYQAVVDERKQLTEQISGLTVENAGMRDWVETLEAGRREHAGEIETLQSKLALMEKFNPLVATLVSPSMQRLAVLLVVPMVPIAFGTLYVVTHKKATKLTIMPTTGRSDETTIHAALTREEFHLIAQRRKLLRAGDQAK